jgi:DNA-binding transcriptional ArsR family regulator
VCALKQGGPMGPPLQKNAVDNTISSIYNVSIMRNHENPRRDPPPASQGDSEVWELQADICQVMANPKRLQILHLLKEKERSVGEMVQVLGVAKANLSQHLSLMRQKGIVIARRQGTTIYYRLAIPHITEACEIMREVLLATLAARGKLHRSLVNSANLASPKAQSENRKTK